MFGHAAWIISIQAVRQLIDTQGKERNMLHLCHLKNKQYQLKRIFKYCLSVNSNFFPSKH